MYTLDPDNKINIIFEYEIETRLLGLVFRSFSIMIGLFLLIPDEIWVKVFAVILIIFGLIGFLDMLLFKSLIFDTEKVIKKWFLFGTKKLEINDLEVGRVIGRYGGGVILFSEKNKRFNKKSFSIDELPLSRKDIQKIKDILLSRKIIEEDTIRWDI